MGVYSLGFYEQRGSKNPESNIQNEVVTENQQTTKTNIAEYLKYDLFDYALIIGMTPEQYWCGNPQMLYNYKRAYEFTQKKLEQHIWLSARYNQCAVSSSVVNVAGITDYKKYKIPDMPPCPYLEEEKEKRILTEQDKQNERLRAYAFFKNLKVKK